DDIRHLPHPHRIFRGGKLEALVLFGLGLGDRLCRQKRCAQNHNSAHSSEAAQGSSGELSKGGCHPSRSRSTRRLLAWWVLGRGHPPGQSLNETRAHPTLSVGIERGFQWHEPPLGKVPSSLKSQARKGSASTGTRGGGGPKSSLRTALARSPLEVLIL